MLDDQKSYDGFLSPGTCLDKYQIVRGLAVGGMAELYLARTTGMKGFRRLVALKRILPTYAASPEFTSMFVDEARLVARLEHPNIAQVFDIGHDDAGLFFTMEYVHGPDVRKILQAAQQREEPVPLAHAIAIVSAAARALHAAHTKRGRDGRPLGIVHRDVSPSNILVSFDGIVKMIDFGVAKARLRKTKTRDGTIKGKVSYMSPEQGRGDVLDSRSDIFSLGTLLWELSTTRKLYFGNSDFAILRQIVHKNAPRPSEVVPDYPAELEAIVMRALSRNIGRRYQSASDLADDLDELAKNHGYASSPSELGSYVTDLFPGEQAAGEAVSEWCEIAGSGAVANRSGPDLRKALKAYRAQKAVEMQLAAAKLSGSCSALSSRHRGHKVRSTRRILRSVAGLSAIAALLLAALGATLDNRADDKSAPEDTQLAIVKAGASATSLAHVIPALDTRNPLERDPGFVIESVGFRAPAENLDSPRSKPKPEPLPDKATADENAAAKRGEAVSRRASAKKRKPRKRRHKRSAKRDATASKRRQKWDPDSALPPPATLN